MTSVSVVRAATAAAVATTQVISFHNRSNRRQVKDFNDCITCSLCGGYLIEATTIDDCVHTFCRSCIVRYLESNKYCPKCKSYNNKTIKMANLRPDRILKSLVYKLVPGLYKSENQRVAKFFADQSQDEHCGSRKPPDHGYLEDQNFFSPDELICLKLEYHYNSIADYDPKSTKLPVTHLRCPAAVTIHHLYKFILTKNGLQLGNERIQVDIIYEEEVLPHDFTLMDVAYCFDYKRVSQMRLFYRIFIHPTAKPSSASPAYNVGSDKNSNENNNSGGGERSANNSHSSTAANLNESQGSASSSSPSTSPTTSSSPQKGKKCDSSDSVPSKSEQFAKSVDEVVDKASSSKSITSVEKANYIRSANSCAAASERKCVETSEKSNTPALAEASCYKAVESKYDSKLIITKTNKADKSGGEKREKETLKLVLVSKKSDRNDAKIVYSKCDSKSSKSPKQNSPSSSAGFSDFKRLRSNDIRYSDYETPSSSSNVSSRATAGGSKSGTVPDDDSRKSESQNVRKHNKINNDHNNISDSSGKKFCEDNSRSGASGTGNGVNSQTGSNAIPTQSGLEAKTKHEKSKSSPRRNENNGAAVAITASTSGAAVVEKSEKSSELKCYVNLKKQTVVSPLSSSVETSANRKPEVPKLKIELPSLKTKISIPRPDNEKSPKSAHTSSTSSSAATSPAASSSNSGKSPIWPKADDCVKTVEDPPIGIEEYAKTIGLKPVQKISEGGGDVKKKKKSSTSTSPDPSFHRKRKKAKHSKEAGSKRRKLHAEISSQHDESLKMKVKLTEKPSKHERKASEEITPQSPKELAKQNAEVTSSSLPSASAASPPSSSSSSAVTPSVSVAPIPSPKDDALKVIDITKGDDDDDVKIIEHPTMEGLCPTTSLTTTTESVKSSVCETTVAMRVNELPKLPSLAAAECSTKAKINEMRAIRHKPMVYIPNLDKNLSDNSSTINSIIESVQAKTGFIDKDNDVQVVPVSKSGSDNGAISKMTLPGKATSAVTTMKPPAMTLSSASSRTAVAANVISRPQHRMSVQSQVFSPRHTPNYPPLVLQSSPKKITPTNSTNVYQPRNVNPALKRSTSVDSGSTYNFPPKTPRVDLMELNAQNRLMKKPIYAPMFNFVKGSNLARNGNANMPVSANDVPYKSSISSSYTKEVNAKKSVPSLLLPPSSISVTKMTDSVPQPPPPIDNRPALEIVRIPSTAPVADKPQPTSTPPVVQKLTLTPKTTRPPPPTIPLIKIKKSASVPEQPSSPISPSVFQVTSSNANTATNLSTSSASHQDTSGALDLTTRASDDLIILESSDSLTSKLNNGNEPKQKLIKTQTSSDAKSNSNARIEIDSSRLELINSLIQTSATSMIKAAAAGSSVMAAKFHSSGIPGLKLPADMIGFAISSPNSNSVPKLGITYSSAPTSTIKSIPMPRLTEINRNRNAAVRQPNPSVRSIPNPSALAFRNQTIAISSSSCVMPTAASFSSSSASSGSTITSLSPTSPAKIMNVNMKINNASTTAGQKSSVNYNGTASTSSSNITDTFSSYGSSSKTYTSAISTTAATSNTNTIITISSDTSSEVVSSNLNGSNNNNSSSITNNNNNNIRNDGVSSTSGGGSNNSKKTIEKVAAGLKAAAATATTANVANAATSRVSSNGNAAAGINKNGVNVV
ncbi:protein suppressor 2 of zeste-like [Toxorhynchites rutilus septentrionalis]|uniref:protein suppressor 2 of zeste-like n=1 Tax=Toxorhynchites rutilus septentrionalis TaxID=329112 RepID=UPI00247A1746|nr:protein suppressor 2 of zeste-like [Toxorhynchites rutilus septentrionalis]XP_055624507.1 protein suppressor 2 of zeste-like [Toxorhynchites rutilus septentrionalis]